MLTLGSNAELPSSCKTVIWDVGLLSTAECGRKSPQTNETTIVAACCATVRTPVLGTTKKSDSTPNITGFTFSKSGRLTPLAGSTQPLNPGTSPGSLLNCDAL